MASIGTANVAARQTQMSEWQDNLGKATESLQNCLSDLIARLEPVVMPMPPAVESKQPISTEINLVGYADYLRQIGRAHV